VVAAASLAWWVGLALAEGKSGLVRGPSWSTEYLHDVPAVRADPGHFLHTFTDEIGRYEIHVRGHPPGMVLLLADLDAVGLGGPRWEAALVLSAAATAPVAVLLAVREVAGEDGAPQHRLVLARLRSGSRRRPMHCMALRRDGRVALLVLATGRRRRRSWALAVATGCSAAASCWARTAWCSSRRSSRSPRGAAATSPPLVAAVTARQRSGLDCWATRGSPGWRPASRVRDPRHRSAYLAFFGINLERRGRWRSARRPSPASRDCADRWLWWLVGGGLAGRCSPMSVGSPKAVERIWLPFGLGAAGGSACAHRAARLARGWRRRS
jgi:hypothetical protein